MGHGLRERQLAGPVELGGPPEALTLKLRRFRCRACEAVVVSAPRGLLRGLLYGAAVALALALCAAEGWSGARVRQETSPWPSSGSERFHGWRSLRGWANRAEQLWGLRLPRLPPRHRARSAVSQLAARSPEPSGPLARLACSGALRS